MTENAAADASSPESRGSRKAESKLRRDKKGDLDVIGTLIAGKYRVLEVLGQGGFGSVFLVEMESGIVGDQLAMKILPKAFSADDELRDQFINEIRVAMRMVNKYIVQIRDVGTTDDGLLYYTMDYVQGRTLSMILRECRMLSPPRAVRICMRVLKALRTAHSENVIHRDLKPANIMVNEDDNDAVKILDFGIATAVNTRDATQSKGFAGSPHYMPPEQFLGTEMGFYTDLYSIGVILYQCLTGQKPYSGNSPQEIYNNLKAGPPVPVDEIAPEVVNYDGLSHVVMRALERNPEKRFQSAREFYDHLEAIMRGDPLVADEVEAEQQPSIAEPPSRRRGPARRAAPPVVARAPASRAPASRAPVSKARARAAAAPKRSASSARSDSVAGIIAAIVLIVGGLIAYALIKSRSEGPAPDSVSTPSKLEPAPPDGGGSGGMSPDLPRSEPPRLRDPRDDGRSGRDDDGPGVTSSPDALIGAARRALDSRDWSTAAAKADAALELVDAHPEALEVLGAALAGREDWKRAFEVLSRLVELPRYEPSDAVWLRLADACLESGRTAEAEPILLDLRTRLPKDDEIALRLVGVYEALERPADLRAFVAGARADGVDHERIVQLADLFAAEDAAARMEEFTKHANAALEAYRDRRLADALAAAQSALALETCCACMAIVRVEALSALGDLMRARQAIARLDAILAAGDRTGLDACLPGVDRETYHLWRSFFAGRHAALELDAGDRDAARIAIESLTRAMREIDAAKHPDLHALAVSYRGSALARRLDTLAELEAEFRAIHSNSTAEVVFTQAKAYKIFADRIDADDIEVQQAREKDWTDAVRSLRSLERRRQSLEDGSEKRKVEKEVAATTEKVAKLEKEIKAQAALRAEKDAALEKSDGRYRTLFQLASLPDDFRRQALYAHGRVYMERGELSGGKAFLQNACKRFDEARIEAGLDTADLSRRLARCYELRGSFFEAGHHYKAAFEKEAGEAVCLKAADNYLKAHQRRLAQSMLESGLEEFPASVELRRKLAEVKR